MTKIYYNKDASIELAKELTSLAERMQNATSGLLKRSKSYIDKGLADVVANDTAKASSSAEGIAYDSGNAIKNSIVNIFNKEVSFAKDIDNVSIPKDFCAENAMEINYYNSVLLNKVDGKSVNEGHKTNKVDDIKDSNVEREELSNINDDETVKQEFDNVSSLEGQANLQQINENKTEKEIYDDSSRIKYTNIDNISGNITEAKTYDDFSQLRPGILKNIDEKHEEDKYEEDKNKDNYMSMVEDVIQNDDKFSE